MLGYVLVLVKKFLHYLLKIYIHGDEIISELNEFHDAIPQMTILYIYIYTFIRQNKWQKIQIINKRKESNNNNKAIDVKFELTAE